jgi:hypothetical protein
LCAFDTIVDEGEGGGIFVFGCEKDHAVRTMGEGGSIVGGGVLVLDLPLGLLLPLLGPGCLIEALAMEGHGWVAVDRKSIAWSMTT